MEPPIIRPKKKPDNPPDFPESYRKARKNYGLFSAILIAWEMVGIRIREIPLANLNIELENPDMAPLVLIALVIYFAVRFTIEWKHTHPQRQELMSAQTDYWLTHALAYASVSVYVYSNLPGSENGPESGWLFRCYMLGAAFWILANLAEYFRSARVFEPYMTMRKYGGLALIAILVGIFIFLSVSVPTDDGQSMTPIYDLSPREYFAYTVASLLFALLFTLSQPMLGRLLKL